MPLDLMSRVKSRPSGLPGVMAGLLLLAAIGPAHADPPVQVVNGDYHYEWTEVLTVTDEWLVLRNQEGQQYPVAFQAINQFIVRWPTSIDRITPTALLEVTGRNLPSNRILTDQVDVYEGGAQALVAPGMVMSTNKGYPITPIDFLFNPDAYGDPFPGLGDPIQGGQIGAAGLIHVVGPMMSRIPLMVGFPLQPGIIASGNAFLVVPTNAGLNLSQVTIGTPSMIQEGDIAFIAAESARPRTLVLARLVVYKTMPVDQFAPQVQSR